MRTASTPASGQADPIKLAPVDEDKVNNIVEVCEVTRDEAIRILDACHMDATMAIERILNGNGLSSWSQVPSKKKPTPSPRPRNSVPYHTTTSPAERDRRDRRDRHHDHSGTQGHSNGYRRQPGGPASRHHSQRGRDSAHAGGPPGARRRPYGPPSSRPQHPPSTRNSGPPQSAANTTAGPSGPESAATSNVTAASKPPTSAAPDTAQTWGAPPQDSSSSRGSAAVWTEKPAIQSWGDAPAAPSPEPWGEGPNTSTSERVEPSLQSAPPSKPNPWSAKDLKPEGKDASKPPSKSTVEVSSAADPAKPADASQRAPKAPEKPAGMQSTVKRTFNYAAAAAAGTSHEKPSPVVREKPEKRVPARVQVKPVDSSAVAVENVVELVGADVNESTRSRSVTSTPTRTNVDTDSKKLDAGSERTTPVAAEKASPSDSLPARIEENVGLDVSPVRPPPAPAAPVAPLVPPTAPPASVTASPPSLTNVAVPAAPAPVVTPAIAKPANVSAPAPTVAPAAATASSPAATPAVAPVAAPVIAPVATPVPTPVAAPVAASVTAPVTAPVVPPVSISKSKTVPPAVAAPTTPTLTTAQTESVLESPVRRNGWGGRTAVSDAKKSKSLEDSSTPVAVASAAVVGGERSGGDSLSLQFGSFGLGGLDVNWTASEPKASEPLPSNTVVPPETSNARATVPTSAVAKATTPSVSAVPTSAAPASSAAAVTASSAPVAAVADSSAVAVSTGIVSAPLPVSKPVESAASVPNVGQDVRGSNNISNLSSGLHLPAVSGTANGSGMFPMVAVGPGANFPAANYGGPYMVPPTLQYSPPIGSYGDGGNELNSSRGPSLPPPGSLPLYDPTNLPGMATGNGKYGTIPGLGDMSGLPGVQSAVNKDGLPMNGADMDKGNSLGTSGLGSGMDALAPPYMMPGYPSMQYPMYTFPYGPPQMPPGASPFPYATAAGQVSSQPGRAGFPFDDGSVGLTGNTRNGGGLGESMYTPGGYLNNSMTHNGNQKGTGDGSYKAVRGNGGGGLGTMGVAGGMAGSMGYSEYAGTMAGVGNGVGTNMGGGGGAAAGSGGGGGWGNRHPNGVRGDASGNGGMMSNGVMGGGNGSSQVAGGYGGGAAAGGSGPAGGAGGGGGGGGAYWPAQQGYYP